MGQRAGMTGVVCPIHDQLQIGKQGSYVKSLGLGFHRRQQAQARQGGALIS
jgi:hypothetical protein